MVGTPLKKLWMRTMGLFDFGKSIGAKLFEMGDDGRAAKAVKEYIDSNNPGVVDLEVEVDDGVCTLCGKAATRSSFEKVVLMAGNVHGITEVNASEMEIIDKSEPEPPKTAAQEAENPVESVVYYEIKSGDTLSKIAKEFLGDAMKYPDIFEANREVIQDPNKIYPGQKIRIPK